MIDPIDLDPEEFERIEALKRERKTDLAAENVWRKRKTEQRKRAGLPPVELPNPLGDRRKKKKERGKKLPLAQRAQENFNRLGENNTPQQFMRRMQRYSAFSWNPQMYVYVLLQKRKLSNLTYQIPHNWQEDFAPLLWDNHIRASYITKAVGMCSIRALFDQFDTNVKKIYKKGFFNCEEGNKKAMGQGRRAHQFFEDSILELAQEYERLGKKVSYDWSGFVTKGVDLTIVQEKQLESMVTLPEFPYFPLRLTGKPDLFFGKGLGRTGRGTEGKTNVHNYTWKYLVGCILQGLDYLLLGEQKIQSLNPGDNRDYELHVVETLRPYDEVEFDSYVLDNDSGLFLKKVQETMTREDPFDRKLRVLIDWNDFSKNWIYRTLTDLLLHRMNPRLFYGNDEIKDCHRFGGCKYIKAGCPQYLYLSEQEKKKPSQVILPQ